MAYIALYRACRPRQFREIVGQEHISKTLKNAVTQKRVAHAYLFCGPRGTGKTSTAKVLAKAVNCLQGDNGEPCNICNLCQSINNNSAYDIIEIDGASNRGIDEIRDLREKVRFAPAEARFKVYIIDEVHMLTTEAFNALLKTLEEPPEQVIFILATTEPHKVPLTILSRCQRFDFRRITSQVILAYLEQVCRENQIQVTKEALYLIARAADGGMRDALSLLDQAITFGDGEVTLDLVTIVLGTVKDQVLLKFAACIQTRDSSEALGIINEITEAGKDVGQFVWNLLEHFRNLLLLKSVDRQELISAAPELLALLKQQAAQFEEEELFQAIEILAHLEKELRWAASPKILLEVTVVRMCRRLGGTSPEALINRIKQLEQQVAEGINVTTGRKSPVLQEMAKQGDIGGKAANDAGNKPMQAVAPPQAREQKQERRQKTVFHQNEGLPEPEKKIVGAPNLTIDQLGSKWPEVLTLIKKESIFFYTLLVNIKAAPAEVEGKKLILQLAREFDQNYYRETVEQPENKKILGAALEKVFHVSMDVTCRGQAGQAVRENKNNFAGDVEKAMRLFGEDVVEKIK